MPDVGELIPEFLEKKVWAVVGASRDESRFGYKVFKALLDSGYKVYPINPSADEIAGVKAYPRLSDLPEKPDVVDTVVPSKVTEKIVAEVAELGIKRMWMQPGSESDEAIRLAEEKGIIVVHNACAMSLARKIHGT